LVLSQPGSAGCAGLLLAAMFQRPRLRSTYCYRISHRLALVTVCFDRSVHRSSRFF